VTSVVVLDYGSGNVRSAQRALERVGADVTVTADPAAVADADGLVVPGVGAFAACMEGLRAADAPRLIGRRLAGGRPVLGICVGMQVLFETGVEHGVVTQGLGEWPGTVERLTADVLPHMGWNTVDASPDSVMLAGLDDAYFYFVHSYAAREWQLVPDVSSRVPRASARVSWTTYGAPFVSAVENGPLWATQFHPEKSGDTGAELLANWLRTLA
jgi:imidazole glycerol-phosphate synthase subunit HisH